MNENQIDHYVSWNLDSGTYIGTLMDHGNYSQEQKWRTREFFRFVFEVDHPDSLYCEYRAQKRYATTGNYMDAVRKDLVRWLGEDFVKAHPGLKIEDLYGMKAKLRITTLQ